MGKINLLSEELCNRIAAGEVIDRPYSAVKELIENSIDAGSTEIEVYIERGGKDLIRVVDNGCGIETDDMRTAFLSHATSKICEISDIDHIHTLGFRGEALATIASIACVELISSVDGITGNKVESDGVLIGKCMPAVCPKGTQISITKFFFNTPVRYKFLKTDKKEEADITSYITHYILGYPYIAFKYFIDGKLALQSYGGGLEEAITQVYGANVLPNCFKISADRNDIKITGFISNQNFFKSNKTYQNVFLNGRHVVNSVISGAITNAYSAYAMKRQYPFYVLFIEMNDEFVDINVHPNKADVRFIDNSVVYGTVYKVISTILDGTAKAVDFVVTDSVAQDNVTTDSTAAGNAAQDNAVTGNASRSNVTDERELKPVPKAVSPLEKPYAAEFVSKEKIYDKDFSDVAGIEQFVKDKKKPVPAAPVQPKIDAGFDYSPYENYQAPKAEESAYDLPLHKFYEKRAGTEIQDAFTFCSGINDPKQIRRIEEEKLEQQRISFEQWKFRGSFFDTYLAYEVQNDVYLIDQHAAHERMLYDGYIAKLGERQLAKQGLLVPYILTVNTEERQFLLDNLSLIWRMGFSVEEFSPVAFRVNEIPADLPEIQTKEFFAEILGNIHELKEITLVDVLKEKIAQTACKHAIKGGDVLTETEREGLIQKLKGNLGLKCPHGRPVCVKISKTELEKLFKRKV